MTKPMAAILRAVRDGHTAESVESFTAMWGRPPRYADEWTDEDWSEVRALIAEREASVEREKLRTTAAVPRTPYVATTKRRLTVHLLGSQPISIWWANFVRPSIHADFACGGSASGVELVRSDQATPLAFCKVCREVVLARALGAIEGRAYTYYAKRDGLIKIGMSRNVGRRMAGLNAELLAVEPCEGDGAERARHAQFDSDRVTGEWFDRSAGLMAHIETLRVKS